MRILDRVRLFLRSKHRHLYRPEGKHFVCACGLRQTLWQIYRSGRISDQPGWETLDEQLDREARLMASLDFHAGEQH